MTAEEFFRQGNEFKKKGDLKNANELLPRGK